MKILANDGISASGKQKLEAAGFEVVTETVDQDDLENIINEENYSALLVRSATKVRQPLIDACPNLKLIGRGGVGMDNIDVAYARSIGREVINTPAASSQSVAELVMAHLFSISRSVYDSNRNMPANGATEFKTLKKKYAKGVELRGKTIGIIGFGRIGQSTATYALGCGMKVVAYDPFLDQATLTLDVAGQQINTTVETTTLDDLLNQSDYISMHVPMPEDGRAILGADEFNKMKDGIRIVNAARGGVIDEDALLDACRSGKVAACALDVFVGEPSPREDVLTVSNMALTPHIGAATVEAQDRIGIELADKIIAYFGNQS
ncbi:MAG: 3-phosphoglycerate dehydrogenase [Crocinitomicaceae bacterium]|nr:3-phosphoglycerate dehydrogenase [Crocinitomicaceae bacterium]